jgi:hypothetical protein
MGEIKKSRWIFMLKFGVDVLGFGGRGGWLWFIESCSAHGRGWPGKLFANCLFL